MPRIKKADVPKTERTESSKVRDESIQVKRIHRKSPVLTVNPIVIPNTPNVLYDATAPVVETTTVTEEIINSPIEPTVPEEPVITEEQKEAAYDAFIDRFAEEFTTKPIIEKVESDIKTSEEKIQESDACDCQDIDVNITLGLGWTSFMSKFFSALSFIFASTILLGLNILLLTFFAYLMAGMFH